MKSHTLRLLAVTLATTTTAWQPVGAYPIEVPNWNFETPRSDFPSGLVEGGDAYMIPSQQSWHQYDVYTNGGTCIYWNPGVPGVNDGQRRWADVGFEGNAPEGTHVGLSVTRYNDDKLPDGTSGTYVRDFEAICQVLENTSFDPAETYTLTVKVGHLPNGVAEGGSSTGTPEGYPEWNGYKVQLVAGGVEAAGVGAYAPTIYAANGGTVIAEDDNTVTIAPNTFETIVVTYTGGSLSPQWAAALKGLPLQIRLCALEDPNDHSTKSMVAFDAVTLDGPPPPPSVVITPPGNGETNYTLEWNSYEGRIYNVLASNNLESWSSVATSLAATPPNNTHTVAPNGSIQFYKIEQLPSPTP